METCKVKRIVPLFSTRRCVDPLSKAFPDFQLDVFLYSFTQASLIDPLALRFDHFKVLLESLLIEVNDELSYAESVFVRSAAQ